MNSRGSLVECGAGSGSVSRLRQIMFEQGLAPYSILGKSVGAQASSPASLRQTTFSGTKQARTRAIVWSFTLEDHVQFSAENQLVLAYAQTELRTGDASAC